MAVVTIKKTNTFGIPIVGDVRKSLPDDLINWIEKRTLDKKPTTESLACHAHGIRQCRITHWKKISPEFKDSIGSACAFNKDVCSDSLDTSSFALILEIVENKNESIELRLNASKFALQHHHKDFAQRQNIEKNMNITISDRLTRVSEKIKDVVIIDENEKKLENAFLRIGQTNA